MLSELIEQSHPSCGFFGFLIAESWIVIDEKWANVRQNEGEDARVFRWMWYIAAVHENVFTATMAMEVSKD